MDGANASNVPAGVLSLKVTDALGSEADFQIEMVEPTLIVANAIAEAPASTGNEDGSARVEGTGGSDKYTPLWDNGEVTQTAVALAPGEHSVTITDDAGCTAVAQVTITENILPIDGLISAPSEVMCNGGTASLQAEVTGGKGPYQYAWSDGQTTETATELGAATYEVTVTDALGTEIVRNFTILEPQVLSVAAEVIAVASTDEADGSVQSTVNGGVEPYIYSWNGGTAEETLEAVGVGSYTITVTDANGCTAEASVEMTEDILPLTLDIERDNSQLLCFGQTTGIAKALPQGGKRPFSYAWSDGNTEAERNDLGKGEYVITVTDALATEATAMVMIIEPALLEATAITVASASTDNSDGQATAQPTGGTAPYSYAWSNGEAVDAAVGLGAGQHTVTVTDVNGCTAESIVEITEDILPLGITVQQSSEISCAGMKNADLTSTVSGGKGPFQLSWSNGGAGEAINGLGAGSYAVTVTDAIGQSAETQFEVTEPAGLDAELVDIRAAGAEHVPDGKATVQITGGAGNYSYAWDSGESGESANELSIGSHTVTVTDANGCSTVLSTEITKKILPTLTADALNSGQAVRMEKLQFEADSTVITNESVPTLTELYEFLYDNPSIVVEVGGHTNGLPEHAYCDSLSRLRAKSVAEWIVNEGIDEKRVYFRGYGKRDPVATNRTPEGRRKNQRVEVKIVRLEED